ncbi:MAG: hypothetical protein ACTHMC_16575 [Pseudobacter sp.]|uniref:hypothetical protein n=1 Tax=Pseudobacter sp. TaxID=2045420 RepID=UPI003F82058D
MKRILTSYGITLLIVMILIADSWLLPGSWSRESKTGCSIETTRNRTNSHQTYLIRSAKGKEYKVDRFIYDAIAAGEFFAIYRSSLFARPL